MSEVISLQEIKEKAKGTILEIPDWEPGKTIKVRVRSIDVTPHLMSAGSIPNELKAIAVEAFEGSESDDEIMKRVANKVGGSSAEIERFMPILNAIASEALAEPTYQEIEEIYPLTLQQKMSILNFVMGEVDDLKPFRKKS